MNVFDHRQHISLVILVGAGGTGSKLARSIACILYDMKLRRKHIPKFTIIDMDRIEAKNIGRQLFLDSEISQFKSEVVAARLNAGLGLEIEAVTEPFNVTRHVPGYGALLVGAVDNHLARAEMARAENSLWLDTGNSENSGQVVLGSTSSREVVMACIREGKYHDLPNAALLFPALLEPEPTPKPTVVEGSCADQTAAGFQHLLINDFLAATAAGYIHKLLNDEPITTFCSFINIGGPIAVRSLVLEKEELMAYLPVVNSNVTVEKSEIPN